MNPNKDNKFILQRFVSPFMDTNCYLVADPTTGEACLIDPGANPVKPVKDFLQKNGLRLDFIINTHGHGDHIAANGRFDAPIYIHRLDADFLKDPGKNLSGMFFFRVTSPPAARLLEDGDLIELGKLRLEVIHTPGHTPGSISLKLDGVVFTGDTLFASGVGRTDFVYGDEKALYESIKKKLFSLPDDMIVYPGHGDSSTIGKEMISNPFIV